MEVVCAVCSKEFKVVPARIKRLKNPSNITCSVNCRSKLMSVEFTGENNPNYGNVWDNESRESQSILVKSKVDLEYRRKCAKGRAGKKFTFSDAHKLNLSIASTGRILSHETKKLIGIKSSAKFTDDYKLAHRKMMEDLGNWVPMESVSDYKLYYRLCEWGDISDYVDSEGYQLYAVNGLYSGKAHNPLGVVRDHIFSRRHGFNNRVFPGILKHPCNLQFLSNVDNIKKSSDSWIELEELFTKIEEYKNVYRSQCDTLNLINRYREGYRYERHTGGYPEEM